MATNMQGGWASPLKPGSWNPSAWYHKPGPTSKWSKGYHTGIDFSAPAGTPVYAITDGVLTRAGNGALGSPLGIALQLAFDDKSAIYAHLQSLAPGMRVGRKVRAGELIGYVGSSGTNSSGAHLHFEIQNQRSGWGQDLDPHPYIVGNHSGPGYSSVAGGQDGTTAPGTGSDDPATAERNRAEGDGNLNDGSGGNWLARFLYAKGLRGDDLKTAWAIAMRESRGMPGVDNEGLNRNDTVDYGLFQINSVHAKRIKEKFGWSMNDLRDPNKAFAVYWWMSNGGKELGAWDLGSKAYAGGRTDDGKWASWAAKFDRVATSAGLRNYSGATNVGKPERQGKPVATTKPGGGGGSTGSGANNGDEDTAPAGSLPMDMLDPKKAAEWYGYAYAMFKSDKELLSILNKAIKGRWNQTQFMAAVQNSKWFKEHSGTWRDAELLYYTDPAQYQANIAQSEAMVEELANAMGVDLADKDLKDIAWRAYRYGMASSVVRQEVAKHLQQFTTGGFGGQAGDVEDELRQWAHSQGVTMSEDFYAKAAQSVIGGTRTVNDWRDYIDNQAASLFPVFANQILEGGMSVRDLASGYINTYASLLEIDADTVQLNDPMIRQALGGYNNEGSPTAMGLWDFEKLVRNDPRWMTTKNAKDQFDSATVGVLKTFGFMG